jgi:branched-chain amino acid transport system permease protein
MTSTDIAMRALDGLQLSAVLMLLAAGFTLVANVLRFVNLAHGAIYGFAVAAGVAVAGLVRDPVIAVAVSIAAAALLGLALERYVLRPFLAADSITQLLITVAVAFVLADVATILAVSVLAPPPALPLPFAEPIELVPGLVVPLFRLMQIGLGILAAVVLVYVVQGTQFGLRLRAVAADPGAAATLGIDQAPLRVATFVVAAGLAGLAAAVAVSADGFPSHGSDIALLYVALATAVAGVRSLPALAGICLLIGLADTLGRSLLTETTTRFFGLAQETGQDTFLLVLFGLAAIVLAVRPRGIAAPARE